MDHPMWFWLDLTDRCSFLNKLPYIPVLVLQASIVIFCIAMIIIMVAAVIYEVISRKSAQHCQPLFWAVYVYLI
jgi:hypothetical protein